MSAASSLHRAEEASKSRSQVRGRPAILLDGATVESLEGSEPYSPSSLFSTRDVNAMAVAGSKSFIPSKPPSTTHPSKPASVATSRAHSGISASSSLSRRATPASAAPKMAATRPIASLPPFASSLSHSTNHASLSAAPSHPFHRDEDHETSQLLLIQEDTNLEMPASQTARAGAEGMEVEPESPIARFQREDSSWSGSAPASRNASPPPRPAELATDFPTYEDSLSSASSRRAAVRHGEEEVTSFHAQEHNAQTDDAGSPHASPTPPPRRAVVLTASASSSFVVPTETAQPISTHPSTPSEPARGSTLLVSAAESEAFTSLFRLQRRVMEGTARTAPVVEATEAAAVPKTAVVATESLVLTTDGLGEKTPVTTLTDAAPQTTTLTGTHMTDDSLETRLYPLHPDKSGDATGSLADTTDAFFPDSESMSPLPRPLRPSQRALAVPEDPVLSAATAEAVREARERRAAAPSADRPHRDRAHDTQDEEEDRVTVHKEGSPDTLKASATTTTSVRAEETPKDSLHIITAASSAVWLTDGKAPVCTDRLHPHTAAADANEENDEDGEARDHARPSRVSATWQSEKPSQISAHWIDSRDFRLSGTAVPATTAICAARDASASPVPTRPHRDVYAAQEEASPTPQQAEDVAADAQRETARRIHESEEFDSHSVTASLEPATGIATDEAPIYRSPETPGVQASQAEDAIERRSLSALDTPSRQVSDEVRRLMEKAQEEVRRTRESLLSTIEKDRLSLQRTSGSSDETHVKESDEGGVKDTHTSSLAPTSETTLMTTVSLSPMTPDPATRQSRGEVDSALMTHTPQPSRVLAFVAPTPTTSSAATLSSALGATPAGQRLSTSSLTTAGGRRTFSWTVAELRTELAVVADAILHRLRGYDRQEHGVLPMEVVLRVTYFVMQQRHPTRLVCLTETPARGGALLHATTDRDATPYASHHMRSPLTTRMSAHGLPQRYGVPSTQFGVKRGSRLTDGDGSANKENIAPSTSAVKKARLELCLRETGSPEPGDAVPYEATWPGENGSDVEDEEEVVGRPATRISPTRTLETLVAAQAHRAEEALCMDLYTTLLSAFREVFGERYAWKHLGATNATRHDAYYPQLTSHVENEEDRDRPRSGGKLSGRQTPKKRVLQDLNDVAPPLETAFPRLRQQYAVRTRSSGDSGRHVCDPRHPPPLDMLVYYHVFVDSLRELDQP